MNRYFCLDSTSGAPVVRLRSIDAEDIEDLRVWRNARRASFFHKAEIIPPAQRAWFEGYLARDLDFMFLVESESLRAGCMGFRILGGAADVYNVMGVRQVQGRGILGRALRLMCSYIKIQHTPSIGCKVVKGDPAVDWFKKQGFGIAAEKENHFDMALGALEPIPYEKRVPGADAPLLARGFFPIPIDVKGLEPGCINFRHLDDGVECLVLLVDGKLKVVKDLCPHMGAPLSLGKFFAPDCSLQCPWHGYKFDCRTGNIRENPNEARFAPLKNLYSSYKPERKLKYGLVFLSYELQGDKAWVKKGGAA